MGSGHFLNEALKFLVDKYIESHYENNRELKLSIDSIKRIVLKSCIYGVDQNYSAVKLAKMSLWLNTASSSKKLEQLDSQLKCFNSLDYIMTWDKKFKFLKKDKFDAIIGNPPYINIRKLTLKIPAEVKNKITDKSNFKYLRGSFDVYVPFIERAFDLVREKGFVSYIVPNKLFVADYAVLLGNFLKRKK